MTRCVGSTTRPNDCSDKSRHNVSVRIFHIATAADWAQAQLTGRYTTSTLGKSLADEGFIHASRADQWQTVRANFYAGVTEPLVLLTMDTETLGVPVVEETVGNETYPHIFGAIDPAKVLHVLPLDGTTVTTAVPQPPAPTTAPRPAPTPDQPTQSFGRLFLGEVVFRVGIGLVVMVAAIVLGSLAGDVWGEGARFPVAVGVLILGLLVGVAISRRRDRRYAANPR